MLEGEVLKIIDKSTVSVVVIESKMHPLYKKIVRRKKKFLCQYSGVELKEKMKVMIKECRPYSKMKKHCVVIGE